MIHIRALREKTTWRETAPSILLVLNSFVWFILIYAVFNAMLGTENLGLSTVYFVSVAVSAILGSKFFPYARAKFLC
jgi:hypothetical protein